MKKDKYKILVLSDMKKSTSTLLKNTVSLAKMINGEIQFFYVRKPTDIIEIDNQLSAMRAINSEYVKTEKKIHDITNSISNEYGINIQYSFAFGNIKDEILLYIKEHNPDIIVLGKRNAKAIRIIGDNVTDLILKTFEGVIMIANNKNTLDPNKELSLGVLNDVKKAFNLQFAKKLMEHTQKPLKIFKIINNSSELNKRQSVLTDNETIEYVFQSNDKALNNISNYLVKSHVNLLCLDRGIAKTKNATSVNSDIKDIINKLNVSILLTAKPNQVLQ